MRHLNVVVYSPQLKPIHFYLTPRYIIYDYCNCMEYHFSLYKEHSFTFFFNSSIHFRQNMMGMNKLLMSSHQDMGRYLKISLPITLATIIVIHNFIPVTIEIYIKLLYWHYTWPLKKRILCRDGCGNWRCWIHLHNSIQINIFFVRDTMSAMVTWY